jgi:hypothetical protein
MRQDPLDPAGDDLRLRADEGLGVGAAAGRSGGPHHQGELPLSSVTARHACISPDSQTDSDDQDGDQHDYRD